MEAIEAIILRHSERGMLKLKDYLQDDYCRRAAEEIMSWRRGVVFMTTGFYVAGFPETDGPAGTAVLASALKSLGFQPIIITDAPYAKLFTIRNLTVVSAEVGEREMSFRKLIAEYQPSGMISIERCGINLRNDYENMRGISIREHNAPIDLLFWLADEFGIRTIGVGDGGNEIGMGSLAGIIQRELSLVPCKVSVDRLVIASVSNWGAYGITAYLSILSRMHLLPEYREIADYLVQTVDIGSVDGVTHERVPHVDGFPEEVEQEIVDALQDEVNLCLVERYVV
jgi:hypothetical protein